MTYHNRLRHYHSLTHRIQLWWWRNKQDVRAVLLILILFFLYTVVSTMDYNDQLAHACSHQ